jgi:hypothetical protein
MSVNNDMLRKWIKELIQLELDEATTTSAVPGYETPNVFGKRKKKKKVEAVTEGKYHEWRNDDSKSPKQKIGLAIREAKKSLVELEKVVGMSVRLRNEMDVSPDSYWKNTHKALHKIGERLVKLANKVSQLR